MKRQLWLDELGTDYCPPWRCPICNLGIISLRNKSLSYEETIESKREHEKDYWGPESIVFAFIAWGDCSHEVCKQSFAISGTGRVGPYFDENHESEEWLDTFTPHSIYPAPSIIDIPNGCPQTVRNLLKQAFSLYWYDSEACAGKLRSSIEALLTHVGVAEMESEKPEKRSRLPLHRRIEIFERESSQLGKHFMAMKWLGNSGSHGKSVNKDDLLDAFEILEHALAELLEKRSEKLSQLADRLTAKHRPQ